MRVDPRGQRAAAFGDEDELVEDEFAIVERLRVEGKKREGEIERSLLDLLQERNVVIALHRLDLHCRITAVVALEDVREDAGKRALECADADRSGLAACEIDEILLSDRHSGRQLVDVTREDGPRLCQRCLCATGRALEQALPDDLLQGRDLLADGRLGVAEHLGRPCERARLGNRRKRGEMPEVEARPKIAQHDESTGIGLSVESYVWPGRFRRAPSGGARGDMDDCSDGGGGLCLSSRPGHYCSIAPRTARRCARNV